MALLDPKERSDRGAAIQENLYGITPPEPRSIFESSWRDFIYSEVWSGTDLDLRARLLIALAGSVVSVADDETFDTYVYAALRTESLSVVELREAALHMGPYGGWPKAKRLDKSISRVVDKMGIKEEPFQPLRSDPWDPQVRNDEGAAEFLKVMTSPSGPPVVPYLRNIHNFVFGEMWRRRALDERSRRWLTLVGVCDSTIEIPIKSHVHAAMGSGNCTPTEMHEFVAQFAVHCGWPKASIVQSVLFEMIKKVEAGQSWSGQ
jgi:4-carboxymuconolactone decarboxylase